MKKPILLFMTLILLGVMVGCQTFSSQPTTSTTTTTTTTTSTVSTTLSTLPVMYENPVWEPVLADPSIVKDDDGYYYAFGTQDYGQWGESFGTRYGPILKSTNLVDWEYAGSLFTMQTRPIWGAANAGVWAPDVVKIGSTYLAYYSLSVWGDPNPGIGVASSMHPLGPWVDHGKLFDSNSIGVNNSIDSTVFVFEDRVYLIWGSFRGLYGVELTADGLALKDGINAINTKVHIAGFDTSTSWNGSTYEAPYIVQKDGYFYLFVSSGTCCEGLNSSYNVRVARSTSPLGPYIDHLDRSILGGNRGYQVVMGSAYFVGTGHNSVIQDEAGEYWIVYHAYDVGETPNFGNSPRRVLMIDKLVWDESGWPRVFGAMPSNRPVPIPTT
jgi:arabinan endo-1,5-alpha-L-arabinosidase